MNARSPTTQLFNSPHTILLQMKTIVHFLLSLLPTWYMPHISKTTMVPHAAVITVSQGKLGNLEQQPSAFTCTEHGSESKTERWEEAGPS